MIPYAMAEGQASSDSCGPVFPAVVQGDFRGHMNIYPSGILMFIRRKVVTSTSNMISQILLRKR